jgi:serine/threonine protein kinase
VGAFEPKVLEALRSNLPDTYLVAPNFQLKQQAHSALEYDFVVVAPHALFVVEAKEWYGRLTGDDTEWLINQTPRKCPMWLVDLKCKVLKTMLGAVGNQLWVEPLLVFPDGTSNSLGGTWAKNAQSVAGLIQFLLDEKRIARRSDVLRYETQIVRALQGAWGARQRSKRRRIGSYEIVDTLYEDATSGEYLARRALLTEDTARYRVRTWRIDQSRPPEEVARRKAVITRPTEAVAKVGRHPNLLPVLQFDFVEDDNEFFEVTEWSDYGTLHGYLHNTQRDRLTLRERFQIAEGVASALEAVHAHGVVHRNVCPEAIVVGFDRTPRLTDFDRAYIESRQTVFEHVDRQRNEAFVPPELADKTDYDFDAASDMYSFGVLLYSLLTGQTPFTGPAAATAAGGRPEKLPSELVEGVELGVDQLILALLNVTDFTARPAASQVLLALRRFAHVETTSSSRSDPPGPAKPPEKFEVGSLVDDVLRIDAELGSGAFSHVYRVYHLDHQETYAMKVLNASADAEVLLNEYTQIGKNLPLHQNIARVRWMARLAPPDRRPYILTEFVDGETLEPYCRGDKRLAWQDLRRIGGELLDALAAMHPETEELEAHRKALSEKSNISGEDYDRYGELQEKVDQGILHRDIKPANILLELPSHRVKLIDFNIATKFVQAQGRGGTPRYWAPDRGQPKWAPNMDLFSVGIVLYELVTSLHPFPDNNPEAGTPFDPRELRKDLHLSAELAEFLLRAVQPAGADRFQTAREMKAALLAVPSMHAPVEPAVAVQGAAYPGLTLVTAERGKANYNPYVTRLLTLYSQASRSNSGTRGLDEIARLTYVKTSLDSKLAPHIADGRFRLVIITGNAGDGKTAFLQQVEQFFADKLGAKLEPLASRNGMRWLHEGLTFETNYDGSQDEGSVVSDEVLARFLSPFAGPTLGGLEGTSVRLIAVNEGRLLDFLTDETRRDQYAGLRDFVLRALDASTGLPAAALLVNLNLRSVAAGGTASLVERQLCALTRPELWAPCDACAHRAVCPLKFNADTMSDEVSGSAVRARVRRLFEVVHLRRKAHVTMRDLRSSLSWLLLRDTGCDDISRLIKSGADAEVLAELHYPEALAERGGVGHHGVDDRLVAVLREADPGRVNAPQLDRRLDRDAQTAVPWMTFEGRLSSPFDVLRDATRNAGRYGDDLGLDQLLAQRRHLVERWRRWAYYERRDDGWRTMLPYRALTNLEALLSAQSGATDAERLRDEVIEAVSLSEGLRHPALLRDYLALRVSRIKDPSTKSYRLFSKAAFEVIVPTHGGLGEYMECAPDALELSVRAEIGRARLRISLDLLEMLKLIRSGYRPSPADLQGMFVNLLIFRNELMNLPFDRIVVTADEQDLYEISASPDPDVGVRLSLQRFASTVIETQVRPA